MLIAEFNCNSVVLIPQNAEWTKTSDMVKTIASVHNKKIRLLGFLSSFVYLGSKIPGKIGGLINKAFGNYCYAHEMSVYPGLNYQLETLKESIKKTEG